MTSGPQFQTGGRTTVLLTGFGPFPGVPVNATMRLVPELAEAAARALPDLQVVTALLATEWHAAPQKAAEVIADVRPDLIVHFGVSSRARGFEIETRARNVCAMSPDASGVAPLVPILAAEGADYLAARLPAQHLVARLRRRGIPAFASRDAGTYLCNALLYHSLAAANARAPGCRIGFVHIPASLARPGGANRGRSGASPLTWAQAVTGGLEIIAGCLGRTLAPDAAHARNARRAQVRTG